MSLIENHRLEVIQALAERYGVNPRTIYRWQRDGVNLENSCEVGLRLAEWKNQHATALTTLQTLLETELKTLTP